MRLLIIYSHFPPAFKGGGPIQSLANLARLLQDEYELYVICSAFDLGDSQPMPGITVNQWVDYSVKAKVFYVQHQLRQSIHDAFDEVRPDAIYVNGLFLPAFNWLPLWMAKRKKIRAIVAPRGMLQEGALSIRPLKKKLFLMLSRKVGLFTNVIWHATDQQEKSDIAKQFGVSATIRIAPNVPRIPSGDTVRREKQPGILRMIFLSLITEKKNLHLVLEALKNIKIPVVFDIYGPVKDAKYWSQCQELIGHQIHTIHYAGPVDPSNLSKVLTNYDVFILPTKGENFGHAIYEAMSEGIPAIISPFTPWGNLGLVNAGLTVDLNNKSIVSAITDFINCDNERYQKLSQGARLLAENLFLQNDYKKEYRRLFS